MLQEDGMKTREEAARFVENIMRCGAHKGEYGKFHFGRCEIRELLDFIYDGPPKNKDEEVFIKEGRD